MSWIAVSIAGAAAVSKIGMALAGSGKRKREQKRAAAELKQRKADYEAMDTSNPYADMENTMEDLTVNTQQAEFQASQNKQNQANIMQNMQGAAGGSGIAGLAQAMANQGAQQAQQASATIGMQEAQNTRLSAQEQSKLNMQEARGEARSQDLRKDKTETLMGMAQQRKAAADAARQRARDQVMSGIGDIGSVAIGVLGQGGAAGLGSGAPKPKV